MAVLGSRGHAGAGVAGAGLLSTLEAALRRERLVDPQVVAVRMKHPVINGVVVLGAAAALFAGFDVWRVLVAAIFGWAILRVGVLMLGGMARPIPEPPPAGELRKVKITYRCDICGTEVRMTTAPDQDPEAPRHCQDDMRLLTPVDDL